MKKTTPIQHCANQRNGKCDGVMIKIEHNKNLTGARVVTWVDDELAGKPCVVMNDNKKCLYFENIVIPGIKV